MIIFKKFFNRYPDTLISFLSLFLYLIFYFVLQSLFVIDIQSIIVLLRKYCETYGYILVFIGGFVETLFLVGIYLPASFTILLGILVAPYNLYNLFMVCLMCIFSALLANIINYIIGRFGFVRFFNLIGAKQVLDMEENRKHTNKSILLSSISPNLLGITVVYHSMKGMAFSKIIGLSFLSTLIWVPILSFIVVCLGQSALTDTSPNTLLYFFFIWIAYLIISTEFEIYREKKSVTDK